MVNSKKVVIHDIYNQMTVTVPSIRKASVWFYNNKNAKTKYSALSNIQNSLKDQRVIYKRYYLTFKEEQN